MIHRASCEIEMSAMLVTAAALIWLTGLAHSVLGERYLLMRLFRREEVLPRLLGSTAFTAGTLRFVWHLLTVVWWGLAYVVLSLGNGPLSRDHLLLAIGVTALVSAVFPLYFTRGKHLSWVALLAVGSLLLASRTAAP
ncbi:MAG: hypothetical protein ACK59X_11875 [Acidovorax sp.]